MKLVCTFILSGADRSEAKVSAAKNPFEVSKNSARKNSVQGFSVGVKLLRGFRSYSIVR